MYACKFVGDRLCGNQKFTRLVLGMPRGDAAGCIPLNHEGRACQDDSSKNRLKRLSSRRVTWPGRIHRTGPRSG